MSFQPTMPARQFNAPPWLSDCGDGTYRNPVLYADYSDPDAIRVGEDYWLTASSFCHAPGLPILHSRDLINWTLVNHALPALVPTDHFATPRHGEGVWAPSLRYHAGKFWIFYPDPDFGLYVITTEDPRGAWSKPYLLKAGKGLIDSCPLWDDDGQAYLIHGWAKSRSGVCNQLTLHRMSPDGTRLLDDGKLIIDGNSMPGWNTIEGPKLYKRQGWYYIFAPAGGVSTGYQAVFRSRNIFGPYENRIVLAQGTTTVNGPHQGAWIDTPGGEHWFVHFQEIPAYGRVMHMQPMEWRTNDWPVMGQNINSEGKGEPVLVHRKPSLPVQSPAAPATSDEFSSSHLGLQWQWQGTPQHNWASLTARDGWLRLNCVPKSSARSRWFDPQLLMQKFAAPAFTATTQLEFQPNAEGDSAGLIVFGYDYAWIGLKKTSTGLALILAFNLEAQDGSSEQTLIKTPVETGTVTLRVKVNTDALCAFSYSLDGQTFIDVGDDFRAVSSKWVGAKVGLFASSQPESASSGHADFDWFRVTA